MSPQRRAAAHSAIPPRPAHPDDALTAARWLLVERDYGTDTIGYPPCIRRWFDASTPAGREQAAAYIARHPDARPVLPLRTRPSCEPDAIPPTGEAT
jgi:hypothetical protein